MSHSINSINPTTVSVAPASSLDPMTEAILALQAEKRSDHTAEELALKEQMIVGQHAIDLSRRDAAALRCDEITQAFNGTLNANKASSDAVQIAKSGNGLESQFEVAKAGVHAAAQNVLSTLRKQDGSTSIQQEAAGDLANCVKQAHSQAEALLANLINLQIKNSSS